MTTPCPCGSGRAFADCCEPFITGAAKPQTAEQLMRSRYSAFATGAVSYLHETLSAEAREDYDPAHVEDWARGSEWLGLDIRATEDGAATDEDGWVEFVARFRFEGEDRAHHESSYFIKRDGQWLYHAGNLGPRPRRVQKVGRNDPCPCGSGKKYKKCCGA
ncbi:YchJ family protein [Novispirillum sp. DQ9]|uniref:YchJ family protein n=1 Tax=Novispirillum sp. DQ9 TaxID=3398612 RepID=UPI003C7B61A1